MRDTGEKSHVTRFCLSSSARAFFDIFALLIINCLPQIPANKFRPEKLGAVFITSMGAYPVRYAPMSQQGCPLPCQELPVFPGCQKGGVGLYPNEGSLVCQPWRRRRNHDGRVENLQRLFIHPDRREAAAGAGRIVNSYAAKP